MTEHVTMHRMTGKALDNDVEVGLYRIWCTCGWETVDVRGFTAMADTEDRHREDTAP